LVGGKRAAVKKLKDSIMERRDTEISVERGGKLKVNESPFQIGTKAMGGGGEFFRQGQLSSRGKRSRRAVWKSGSWRGNL